MTHTTELLKVYKFNLIELAKHHKRTCDGENCNISLYLLYEMGKKLGIKFTKKEFDYFI